MLEQKISLFPLPLLYVYISLQILFMCSPILSIHLSIFLPICLCIVSYSSLSIYLFTCKDYVHAFPVLSLSQTLLWPHFYTNTVHNSLHVMIFLFFPYSLTSPILWSSAVIFLLLNVNGKKGYNSNNSLNKHI